MRRLGICFWIGVVAMGALSACGTEAKEGCADLDCPSGFFCQEEIGECRCRAVDACGQGQFCNSFGVCQVRPPCLGNEDCLELQGPGFICDASDPTGGKCIPATQCGSSVHCELNNFCPPPSSQNPGAPRTCQPGCRNTGDCQLGHICIGGSCVEGGIATDCTLCPASPDPDPGYCDYGEQCIGGDCIAHPAQAGLCQRCDDGLPDCQSGTTCLVDNEEDDQNYCAPICNTDLDCPNGYEGCGPVIRIPGLCNPLTTPTCPNGGACVGGQEANQGFCQCVSDDDCNPYPADIFGICLFSECGWGCTTADDCFGYPCNSGPFGGTCDLPACGTDDDCVCVQGKCFVSDDPCTTAADCYTSCTDGVCPTNYQVCGKTSGLTCTDLTGTAECRQL